ncbi:ABC transporter permease subunit [Niallia circulans]
MSFYKPRLLSNHFSNTCFNYSSSISGVIYCLRDYLLYKRKDEGQRNNSRINYFPLTLGSLIIDMAIISFFKPTGWFNTILLQIGLIDEPIRLVYNYTGAFIACVILGVAFLATNFIGMMDSIDPNLEKASRSLGASEWVTFRRVFYPLIRGGVLRVFALNIIMQIGVYTSAVIVGNPASATRTFAVVAFEEAMRNFNYSMANTVAVVMAITQLVILAIVFALRKRGFVGSASTYK